MNDIDTATGYEIALTEYFDAPRTLVFKNWTHSHLVRGWLLPTASP
jgi:hypothetical protein